MSSELRPDDMEVGMLVTGLGSDPINVAVPTPDGEGVQLRSFQNLRYCGNIYKIVAIMLPYIALETKRSFNGDLQPFHSVDIRSFKFMKVTPEYAKAFSLEADTQDKAAA